MRRTFTLAYPVTSMTLTGAVYLHPKVGARVAMRAGKTGELCYGGLPCQFWYTVGSAELVQNPAEPAVAADAELRLRTRAPICVRTRR